MISYLEWDTIFLGVKTGILSDISSSLVLKNYLTQLKQEGYKLVYFFAEPSNISINQTAISNNGLLVDIKVTYSFDINDFSPNFTYENIKTYENTKTNESIINLALQSGEYSRFNTDKNFVLGTYEKLYKIWILQSISKSIADDVFVYENEGIIKGFISVYENSGLGKIGLLGVDVFSRGEKTGSKLIDYTKNYFYKRGIAKVEVITQHENKRACAFYEKAGFSVYKVVNVYHFWL